MKSPSEIMTKLPLPLKSVVITVMTMLFSHLVVYDLMSVSFFSSMEKASDFRFSDFYTIVADDRAVSSIDDDIVIVPADGYTRRDMARVIDDIDFCDPGGVGLLRSGYDAMGMAIHETYALVPKDTYYLAILTINNNQHNN